LSGGSAKKPDAAQSSDAKKKDEDKKKEMFAKLEQRSLFGGQRPVVQEPQLEGVLGNKALVSGQWVEVGGKFNDWKVVSIDIDRVMLEDGGGQQKNLSFSGATAGGPSGAGPFAGSRPGSTGGAPGPPGASGSSGQPTTASPSGARSFSLGDLMNMSPDEQYQALTGPGGRFQGMSRENFDRLREKFGEAMRRGPESLRGRGRSE
jgi:hypothetical protein